MKRRDFLSSGIVLSSSLLLDTVAAEETAPEAEVLRIALVGCGRQGRALINAGMKIPGLQVTAVCDILPSVRNSTKRYLEFEDETREIAAYADFHEMLANEKERLDAVVIATPDFVHAEQSIAALEAGLAVYCEPMMATHAGDARDMIRASRKSGRLLLVGYERRSDPRYRHAVQKLVDPGSRDLLLGTITHFESQAHRRVHSELIWAARDELETGYLKRYGYESMSEYRNWKQYRKYCNGQCAANLAQQLDVFEWFFGVRPSEAVAMGGLDFYRFGDCFDNTTALLSYPFSHGVVRSVNRVWMTTSGGGKLPFEHAFGEFGSIQTSLSEGFFRLHAEPGLAKWDEFVRRGDLKKENVAAKDEDPNLIKVRETGNVVPYLIPVVRPDSAVRLHLEHFVRAVRGHEEARGTAEQAFASHVIAWKIAEAVEAKKTIRLTEDIFEI